MSREILPNIMGPIVVELTVRIGYAIFTVSTLSFLGVGIQRPSPDWGLAISDGRDLLRRVRAGGRTWTERYAWDAAGLPYRPEDKGWGRGRRPVVNVSYDDAQEYVGWLSAKTGKRYRLPSADEWEYAARAGTTTDYWWGHDIAIAQANYDPAANQILGAKKERGKGRGRTLPVDHFKPNPWGLYQVHGNVSEWCEPQKAEPPPLCGGCFASASYTQRSANRNSAYPPTTLRVYTIGFRVARTLVNTVDDITNVTADEARVINTLRQLCDAYMRNDKLAVEKLEPIATQIGKDLNDRGGLDEMRRVFHQLNGMPGSRTLEMHWNGIGQWMG